MGIIHQSLRSQRKRRNSPIMDILADSFVSITSLLWLPPPGAGGFFGGAPPESRDRVHPPCAIGTSAQGGLRKTDEVRQPSERERFPKASPCRRCPPRPPHMLREGPRDYFVAVRGKVPVAPPEEIRQRPPARAKVLREHLVQRNILHPCLFRQAAQALARGAQVILAGHVCREPFADLLMACEFGRARDRDQEESCPEPPGLVADGAEEGLGRSPGLAPFGIRLAAVDFVVQ